MCYTIFMLRPIVYIATTIILFFIVLFAFSKLFGPIPFAVNSSVTNKGDYFSVSGNGKATAIPDVAKVTVGVQSQGNNVQTTQNSLNTNINKVKEAIKALGIKEDDIKTQNYTIYPQQDYSSGTPRITGYTASENIVVTVRQTDQANAVIDAATANGANNVGGVTFEVSDPLAAQDQARQEAVANAKQSAEQAAKTAGFRLGKMINYSESFNDSEMPMPMAANAGSARDLKLESTTVSPGTSEINLTVYLSYEIL